MDHQLLSVQMKLETLTRTSSIYINTTTCGMANGRLLGLATCCRRVSSVEPMSERRRRRRSGREVDYVWYLLSVGYVDTGRNYCTTRT